MIILMIILILIVITIIRLLLIVILCSLLKEQRCYQNACKSLARPVYLYVIIENYTICVDIMPMCG